MNKHYIYTSIVRNGDKNSNSLSSDNNSSNNKSNNTNAISNSTNHKLSIEHNNATVVMIVSTLVHSDSVVN